MTTTKEQWTGLPVAPLPVRRVTTSVKLDPAVRDRALVTTAFNHTSIGAVCEAALRRYNNRHRYVPDTTTEGADQS